MNRAMKLELQMAKRKAKELLASGDFFHQFVRAAKKKGLVGEEVNGLVLLVVCISRLLSRPLHVFVKGKSSAGKNFLARLVLSFMPKRAVTEVTSVSDQAWNYLNKDFRHTVIYLQESNEQAGNMEPLRLLISEGKLIRLVPEFRGKQRLTQKYVAHGPVSSHATTTKNRLQLDDENRHVSIRIDESEEQTRRILKASTKPEDGLSRTERFTWRFVHRLLEKRIGVEISFPSWFSKVADQVPADDLRSRRYYPAFLEVCRTICLIRSFQRHAGEVRRLEVDFVDYAISSLLFDRVFVESLRPGKSVNEYTRDDVKRLCEKKKTPIGAKDLALSLHISKDQAYGKLRRALAAKTVSRANKSEWGNRKLYIPAPRMRFVPDPRKLFRELELDEVVRFIHPVTGKTVVYRRKK